MVSNQIWNESSGTGTETASSSGAECSGADTETADLAIVANLGCHFSLDHFDPNVALAEISMTRLWFEIGPINTENVPVIKSVGIYLFLNSVGNFEKAYCVAYKNVLSQCCI